MKKDQNEKIDSASKKIFKETGLQLPDSNFEFKVMQQIQKLPIPGTISYKAPFSKWVIPIAVIFILGTILSVIALGTDGSSSLIDKIPKVSFDNLTLPSIQVPKSVIFGLLAFIALVFAQVPLLKNSFKQQ